MKRYILTMLIMLGMTALPVSAQQNYEGYVFVSNADQLKNAIEQNTSAHIKLTADIDMSEWEMMDEFNGVIDGIVASGEVAGADSLKMHKLMNLSSTIFHNMNGANLSYILIDDAGVECDGVDQDRHGIVADYATNVTAHDVIFHNSIIVPNILNRWSTYHAGNMGLFAGEATDCNFSVVLLVKGIVDSNGGNVGGICGIAKGCDFTNCSLDIQSSIYGETGFDGAIGGIVGHAQKDANNKACTFSHCVNNALICSGEKTDMVGGIVGQSDGACFSDCQNNGMITQVETEEQWEQFKDGMMLATASIIGPHGTSVLNLLKQYQAIWREEQGVWLTDGQLELQSLYKHEIFTHYSCAAIMAVLEILYITYQFQDPDEVGGICGSATGGSYLRCSNMGFIRTLDAYGGGIVGYASGGVTIKDCLNTGNVLGREQCGGIVGRLDGIGSSVEACLNTGSYYTKTKETGGPIYGELTNGAVSNHHNFTISNEETPAEQIAFQDISEITKQTLASGQVAQYLNMTGDSVRDVWCQKIGSTLLPMPVEAPSDSLPVVGSTDNAVDPDIDYWIEVADQDQLIQALTDAYACIRLTNTIYMDKEKYNFSSEEFPFHGVIEGQGHIITGVYHSTGVHEEDHDIGLFGYADGAVFRNFTMTDQLINGYYNVGALVGNSTNCLYENIGIDHWLDNRATHAYVYSWGDYCGGLVGWSENDKFDGCHTGIMVNTTGDGNGHPQDVAVGGFVGGAKNSTFTNCTYSGMVFGDNNRVGGIVGEAENCVFTQCKCTGYVNHKSTGSITSIDDELGGIVGYAENCIIDQCSNYGECNGGDAYIGGIVGYAYKSTISNCVNGNAVKGDEYVGGIVGYLKDSYLSNSLHYGSVWVDDGEEYVLGFSTLFGRASDESGWANNYILNGSYDPGSGGRSLITTSQLVSGQVTWWLNGSNPENTVWRQNLEGDHVDIYPCLDATHAVVTSGNFTTKVIISTEEELFAFAQRVNNGEPTLIGELADDIQLSEDAVWTPIGTASYPYRGIFMGGGHTVSGVSVNMGNRSGHAGFFGTIGSNAIINGLIIDGTIDGGSNSGVGGLVGCAEIEANASGRVQIMNCGNKATVTTTGINASGIIGAVYTCENLSLEVTNCFNMGNITASGESAVMCSCTKKNATFTNCWNTGTLTQDVSNNYPFARPGLPSSTINLINCYQMVGLPVQLDLGTFRQSSLGNGCLCLYLNNSNLDKDTLNWEQEVNSPYPIPGNRGFYYSRQITNSIGTICLPATIYSSDDVQLYTFNTVNMDGQTVKFTSVDTLLAGHPGVFVAEGVDEIYFKGHGNYIAEQPVDINVSDWTFAGTYEAVKFDTSSSNPSLSDLYYISGNQVKSATKSLNVGANRAYIIASGGQSAIKQFGVEFGDASDEATSIDLVESKDEKVQNGRPGIYNIAGQRVSTLQRGLQIVNGKKILVK